MSSQPPPSSLPTHERFARRTLAWIFAAVVLTLVIGPVAATTLSMLATRPPAETAAVFDPVLARTPWSLLLESAAWACGIGLIATAAAAPVAWASRGRADRAVLAMTPLALPSYLAYASLNLLRAPNTPLDRWLQSLAQSGWTDAPMLAGRCFAAMGLVLWIWPLAAVAMLPIISGIDDDLLDQLESDAPSAFARLRTRLRLVLPGLLAAWGACSLVLLGSPVPLHVAQVPTASMAVWIGLMQDPGNPRHWLAAWPLLAVAALAGAWLSHRLARIDAPSPGVRVNTERRTPVATPLARFVLACSTLLPMVLCAAFLHEWASIPRFLKICGESLAASLGVALAASACSLAMAILFWYLLPVRGRSLAAKLTAATLFAATLAPGVMIGGSLAWVFRLPGLAWLADSYAPLVLAHVIRYASPAVITVLLIARAQGRDAAEMAQLDGADSIRGFLAARVRPALAPLLTCGLFIFSLSLHDIDTSILVLPPGSGTLAEHLLGYLHFSKTEELSAGSLVLSGITLAALGSLAAVRRGGRV
jgi:ABC-type Fe3+ transport system permease subunit